MRIMISIIFKVFAFFILVLSVSTAWSASFDCKKASIEAEKLVCNNPKLSQMDDELGSLYKEMLKDSQLKDSFKKEQRRWLVNDRNSCANTKCLFEIYEYRIHEVQNQIKNLNKTCAIAEAEIIGYWERVDDGDFEEIAFFLDKKKHDFVSWLHQHPESIGSWEIKKCELYIVNSQSSAMNFTYKILRFKNKILYLSSLEDGSLSSYKKIKD